MIKLEVNGSISRVEIGGGLKELIEDTERILITIHNALGKLQPVEGEKPPVEFLRSVWKLETLKALSNLDSDRHTIVDLSKDPTFEGVDFSKDPMFEGRLSEF